MKHDINSGGVSASYRENSLKESHYWLLALPLEVHVKAWRSNDTTRNRSYPVIYAKTFFANEFSFDNESRASKILTRD